MSRNLTSSDRKSLIRLASSLPKGSPERGAILAGLQKQAAGWDTLWESVKAALSGIPGLKVAAKHTDKVDPNSDVNVYFGQGDFSAFYVITRYAACMKKDQIDAALRKMGAGRQTWLEAECYRMVPTKDLR